MFTRCIFLNLVSIFILLLYVQYTAAKSLDDVNPYQLSNPFAFKRRKDTTSRDEDDSIIIKGNKHRKDGEDDHLTIIFDRTFRDGDTKNMRNHEYYAKKALSNKLKQRRTEASDELKSKNYIFEWGKKMKDTATRAIVTLRSFLGQSAIEENNWPAPVSRKKTSEGTSSARSNNVPPTRK